VGGQWRGIEHVNRRQRGVGSRGLITAFLSGVRGSMSNEIGAGAPFAEQGVPALPGAAIQPVFPLLSNLAVMLPVSQTVLSILAKVRANKYLERIGYFSNPTRRLPSARFVSDLGAISSILTTVACDILFITFSWAPLLKIQRQHAPALQALELLYQVVDNPAVLTELGYSDAQTASDVSSSQQALYVTSLGRVYHSSKVWLLVPRQAYFFTYTTASWTGGYSLGHAHNVSS
jgi:hypothetical protein